VSGISPAGRTGDGRQILSGTAADLVAQQRARNAATDHAKRSSFAFLLPDRHVDDLAAVGAGRSTLAGLALGNRILLGSLDCLGVFVFCVPQALHPRAGSRFLGTQLLVRSVAGRRCLAGVAVKGIDLAAGKQQEGEQ